MSETKRNKERVDQAWNKLYDRLDADGLLLSDRQNRKRLSASMLWKWGAVAAIWVGIGVFFEQSFSLQLVIIQNCALFITYGIGDIRTKAKSVFNDLINLFRIYVFRVVVLILDYELFYFFHATKF